MVVAQNPSITPFLVYTVLIGLSDRDISLGLPDVYLQNAVKALVVAYTRECLLCLAFRM